MVVRPQQLEQTLTAEDERVLAAAETRLDSILTERYDGRNRVWVEAGVLKSARQPAIKQLLDRYRQAGWKVEYQSDQRDGDSYSFQKAGERNDSSGYEPSYSSERRRGPIDRYERGGPGDR